MWQLTIIPRCIILSGYINDMKICAAAVSISHRHGKSRNMSNFFALWHGIRPKYRSMIFSQDKAVETDERIENLLLLFIS